MPVAGDVIDRALIERAAQAPVGLAERVVRQARQQVMQCVIAQSDRRPEGRQGSPAAER